MSDTSRSSREHVIKHSGLTRIISAQDFDAPEDALMHYGVKGMKWGVRKEDALSGIARNVRREASKDAQEFARAKMFYGEGAGTRRKLIKAKVEAAKKRNPDYKKAFDHYYENQDLGKHASKAQGERRRKDVVSKTAKTARGVNRQLNGGFGPVSLGAAAVAGGIVVAKKNNVDQILKDAASVKVKSYKNKATAKKTLRDMGL